MRFTVKSFRSKLIGFSAGSIALLVASSFNQAAFAESAFIQQATAGSSGRPVTFSYPSYSAAQPPLARWAPRSGGITPPTPETTLPASGGNSANTLQIGAYNRVFTGQAGSGNISNVGIIKGVANNVGVLQAGHSLVSNLLLVNTAGLSVGVIQPNGSAPLNMLIARLPNGGLLIKR
jgi:hypothetical protein